MTFDAEAFVRTFYPGIRGPDADAEYSEFAKLAQAVHDQCRADEKSARKPDPGPYPLSFKCNCGKIWRWESDGGGHLYVRVYADDREDLCPKKK